MIKRLSRLKISCPLLDLPRLQADELLGKPLAQGAEVGLWWGPKQVAELHPVERQVQQAELLLLPLLLMLNLLLQVPSAPVGFVGAWLLWPQVGLDWPRQELEVLSLVGQVLEQVVLDQVALALVGLERSRVPGFVGAGLLQPRDVLGRNGCPHGRSGQSLGGDVCALTCGACFAWRIVLCLGFSHLGMVLSPGCFSLGISHTPLLVHVVNLLLRVMPLGATGLNGLADKAKQIMRAFSTLCLFIYASCWSRK
jgi:hypothetical protein